MSPANSFADRDETAAGPLAAQRMLPSLPLRMFVHSFQYHPRMEDISGAVPVWPQPYVVLSVVGGELEAFDWRFHRRWFPPEVALSGPFTYHVADLIHPGRPIAQFLIAFQPGGFYRLFGISAHELTDEALSAEDLLGDPARTLRDRIRAARTLPEMSAAAETFLLERIACARAPTAADRTASMQLRARGRLAVAELVRLSGCGRGRFEREFLQRIGVTPKFYARLVRFDYALQLRTQNPELSWMTISHEAGFFDQNHLVKEFKAMTGLLPTSGYEPQWRVADCEGLAEDRHTRPPPARTALQTSESRRGRGHPALCQRLR